MSALQNAENHMVEGNDLQDAQDLSTQEIRELFQDWFENQPDDTHYFELFLDSWVPSELLGFSELGTMQSEFKKWQAETLQKEFETECDEQISTLEIMQEINQ